VRYFEKESRRRFRRELLTRDEAQRIAAIFAGCWTELATADSRAALPPT
jgi:hypothetical protein